MTRLVIVESPTKAKTISGFLPAGYKVLASMGHVRDLPESASEIPPAYKSKEWARLGVDVANDFAPLYVVSARKRKVVQELKEALKEAEELILATDEDREGESIGWHLLEVLKPKVPVRRMVFHEITKEAIQEALRNPRQVDMQLVRAQETRRILDRLVGYTVSPLLWKKIAPGLSAGRVQSVAVRLLVQREEERRLFRAATYWDLRATLIAPSQPDLPFEATLQSVGNVRVATGKDFDDRTGQLIKGRKVLLLDENAAKSLAERLLKGEWRVAELTERQQRQAPPPPFTTSTLQQEANRKLRFSAKQTMQIAQKLYEEGYITYMRTDSVHLSTEAIQAARRAILARYGEAFLSPKPRQYTTKSKNAQEAHEAIRPAGTHMHTAEQLGLRGDEAALYTLIWMRTIACQMADAQITALTAAIQVEDARFQANGRRIDFPGFLRAYVEGSDDPDAALQDRETLLPLMRIGDLLKCRQLEPLKHETQPPPRYTEASLVQTLEREGIGRPSTYASIISTIQERGYVVKQANQLIPTFTAYSVNRLLEAHFPDLVDTQFTARMEQTLDDIATGNADWLPYLKNFYCGENGLEKQVERKTQSIDPRELYALSLEPLKAHVRIGKYGAYLEQSADPEPLRATLPPDLPPAELNEVTARRLLQQKLSGGNLLGYHPQTGEPIYLLEGPYGKYVQLGEGDEESKPKRASLLKGMRAEDVTLEVALGLLSLPRELGLHPQTGKPISAGVGRFGAYVRHGDEFRSLTAADNVLTITLERALELLNQPKGASKARKRAAPLRELGAHPEDKAPIALMDGPYGLYIKHGKTNVKLPPEIKPETLTLAQAVQLLAAKGESNGKPKVKSPQRATKVDVPSEKPRKPKSKSKGAA
ncbi:MAG: type I DNA topoisomerase [Anaerolineae bacterium]|nr:type I DNA topoisomerase [Anaerolineae bacterium]MDW8299681.1 type I DNA topoisomerase [Anaerolineae bacterium]